MSMIRGIVTSVVEGLIKRFSASGRSDETFSGREYLQHYGFTSRPLAGAELIIWAEGNNIIAVASDDRRYRLSLADGEVALYTDEGDKVHLKRGRIIEITGGEKIIASTKVLEATATTSATVTTPALTVVASTSVTMTTPLLAVSGNITCANLTAAVNVADQNGAKTMAGMRTTYNTHNHGTGAQPNQQM